ncbi:MAG: zf-HC2 domain-containing protein [Gemmatimonadaceae bacterium]
MTCSNAQDAAHRYVANRLLGDELEAFETHLLQCEDCRESVRLGSAARAELLPRTGARGGRRMLGFGVLLAAAVMLAVQLRRITPLDALERVAPPSFDGGAARSDADSIAEAVDRGMAAYAAHDYRRAARELARAAERDSTAAVAFYLGVSRIMSRDEAGAVRALARAAQPPGNPYEADARLLTAKTWLRLGHPDSALSALGFFLSDDAAAVTRVRALEDSIRRVRP